MPSVHLPLQARDGLVNKVKFVGSIANVIMTNAIVGLFIHYYLYNSLSTQVFEPFVSGCGVKCFECCCGYKSMH